MAITHIHAIKATPKACIEYCESDKALKRTDDTYVSKDDIEGIIEYAKNDKHVYDVDENIKHEHHDTITVKTLSSYLNCVADNALSCFEQIINKGRHAAKSKKIQTKDGREIVTWHLIQSFKGREVDPETANEIGLKLAKRVFGKHAVVVSTHNNTDDVHNHLVISAWDINGKSKWNDCRETKRLIRKVSDELCEEYGLNVLYDTQDMILTDYVDKDGVRRAVEITDRKMQNWKNYKEGLSDIASANDYRHSDAYSMAELKKSSNVRLVQTDINNLLKYVSSYDELLSEMRVLGYTIKDKTSKGDWRKHITFVSPGTTKGTRDSSIGDGVFYTRESLTKLIESNEREIPSNTTSHEDDKGERYYDDIKYIREFEYGKVNVDDISESYRINIDSSGKTYPVRRSGIEKMIIRDIKYKHRNIGLSYNSIKLKMIVEQMKRASAGISRPYIPTDSDEKVVMMIHNSFEALNMLQSGSIDDHEKLTAAYKSVYEHRSGQLTKLKISEKKHSNMIFIASLPDNIAALEEKINSNNSPEHEFEHLKKDVAKLKLYKSILAKNMEKNRGNFDGIHKSIRFAEKSLAELRAHIGKLDRELDGYELCFDAIKRADGGNTITNSLAFKEFENVRKERGSR
ncbi:MAG: relaxase/mobilization nuclease domain-containing protein [Oscillospiraceae bacterium]|nr:relaxase/mobilization nuclease domain-containing protein [Oscillospiraceae bacterium]MCL2277897.1 relaxase/mobilization nuclease domain-containing protein [Oscillospiraceae bacterium]